MLDKNTSLSGECGCSGADCTCGKRNRFFRGKRMNAGDFDIEQLYSIERRRIINRSIFGSGVVNGFRMTGFTDVEPGFALDRHGREIVLAHAAALGANNVFLVEPGSSGCRLRSIDHARPGKDYVLSVHYAERRIGDADIQDGCGCDRREKNYVCETAVFSIEERDCDCPCGERPCDWTCDCRTDDSCGRPERPMTPPAPTPRPKPIVAGAALQGPAIDELRQAIEDGLRHMDTTGEVPPATWFHPIVDEPEIPPSRAGRGPHACVCHRLTDAATDCEDPVLKCEWNGYFVDPRDGVDLACVRIQKSDDLCRPFEIIVGDACGPRHFVKNNELLYDFIRGCDLTRISWVSWHYWHRRREEMPWPVFARMFRANDGWTSFVVRFSGPVLADTIRYDSVAIRAITIERKTEWRVIHRVPIVRLDCTPSGAVPFPKTTDQMRVFVSSKWIRDEIVSSATSLSEDGFEIEIEIDGFGILDCHRQPIDAEAIGLAAAPTGNGSPGGIYRSAFRVQGQRHSPEMAV